MKQKNQALKHSSSNNVFLSCSFLFACSMVTALEPEGPLALSMSGAGRAITKGAEYHLLNPASLIHFKGAQGSGFYMFGLEKQKPYWGLSLVENQQIPLGLSYIREWGGQAQYLSFSTAGFILPGWSLGLSLSRWQAEPTGTRTVHFNSKVSHQSKNSLKHNIKNR